MSDYTNIISTLRKKIGPLQLEEILSLLENTEIPAGQLGEGSPAQKVVDVLAEHQSGLAEATYAIEGLTGDIAGLSAADAAISERLDVVEGGQSALAIGYATKAAMDADLAHAAGALALVTNDPVTTNNQMYRKSGASGSGSWIVTVDRVADLETRRNALLASKPEYTLSGYKSATVDATGKVVSGFTSNDEFELLGRKPLAELDLILPVTPTQPTGYDLSGYCYAVTDEAGAIAFGVTPAGKVVVPKIDLPNGIDAPAILTILRDNLVLPSRDIVWWGDSLTANISQDLVATYFHDRSVIRRGFGGQTSTLIAARNGGRPIYLTLSGNSLPASGSVAVTAKSPDPFLSTATVGDTCDGRLLNVPVRISQDGSGNYTLTRLVAGAARYVMPASLFVPDNDYTDRIHILWLGRNNYSDPDSVLEDTLYCYNRISTAAKRVLVLSVLNGEYLNERSAGGGYDQIMQCNIRLEQTFPDIYIDVRRLLVESYDSGQADDVTDYGYDQPPSSKRVDNIHLNDAGSSVVLAKIAEEIEARGW